MHTVATRAEWVARKIRAVLTELAETQLELLSSIMPTHAIQFLAMESSEAVPEHFLAMESSQAVPAHVSRLARGHLGVTLLFMDICGYTSMSK
eukprot:scaffold116981_cov15-Tisochrysis_lutea.AAC.1